MAEDPSNTNPTRVRSMRQIGSRLPSWASTSRKSTMALGCLRPSISEMHSLGVATRCWNWNRTARKVTAIPPPGFWLPPDRLRWVNGLNPSMRREDYPDRPWPWELRAYLSPSELWEFRHLDGFPLARERVSTLRVFLRRAEAVQWGLWPALESPQAVASEEPPPREQPGESTVGSAGGEAAPAPAPVADASVPVANTEAPVAKPELASPPLVDATTAETPAANTAPPVHLRRPPYRSRQNDPGAERRDLLLHRGHSVPYCAADRSGGIVRRQESGRTESTVVPAPPGETC